MVYDHEQIALSNYTFDAFLKTLACFLFGGWGGDAVRLVCEIIETEI